MSRKKLTDEQTALVAALERRLAENPSDEDAHLELLALLDGAGNWMISALQRAMRLASGSASLWSGPLRADFLDALYSFHDPQFAPGIVARELANHPEHDDLLRRYLGLLFQSGDPPFDEDERLWSAAQNAPPARKALILTWSAVVEQLRHETEGGEGPCEEADRMLAQARAIDPSAPFAKLLEVGRKALQAGTEPEVLF